MSLNRLRNRFWRRYQILTGRSYEGIRLTWLPKTLEYRGEFGLELLVFLPFIRWLSERGLLRQRTVVTYKGMRPFYRDLVCQKYIERDERREFVPPGDRPSYLPVSDEFALKGPSRFHSYPDLRTMFSSLPLRRWLEVAIQSKPLLIIHNKYTNEWDRGPINYISTDAIDDIIHQCKDAFTIIYIRHGAQKLPEDYTEDQNDILTYNDLKVIARHPEVLLFDDLFLDHQDEFPNSTLNEFKNILCSKCYRFISSQGGGAHHLAYFSGSILSILHREGLEENGAYQNGFYTFLSTPPPLLLCCIDSEELVLSSRVVVDTDVLGGAISIRPEAVPLARSLSATTLEQRQAEGA